MIMVVNRARGREKICPASVKFFGRPVIFIHCPEWTAKMAMSHMSHIVKMNVFMICIFIAFKLVYFTTVNLDLRFKYKRI
jgi:hypothetical protein